MLEARKGTDLHISMIETLTCRARPSVTTYNVNRFCVGCLTSTYNCLYIKDFLVQIVIFVISLHSVKDEKGDFDSTGCPVLSSNIFFHLQHQNVEQSRPWHPLLFLLPKEKQTPRKEL